MVNKATKKFLKPTISLETKISKDVFMLFLALNKAGYKEENNENGMHQARKLAKTLSKNNDLYETNTYFKKLLKKVDPWYLMREILKKEKMSGKNKTPAYYLISNLKKFSKEVSAQKLWKLLKPYYYKESKKLAPIFEKETRRIIKFINGSVPKLNRIILIPNLLDAFWRGYGIKIKDVGYIVVGPGSEKNNAELIRHELLHILTPRYNIPTRLLLTKDHHRAIKFGYIGKKILRGEYTVLAINLIYESKVLKKNIKKNIIREKRSFPHIYEVIKIVEKTIEKERGRLW